MVNSVVLVGRLTKDVELKRTESGKFVTNITVAINDRFKKDHADFINCIVWNQSAEYLSKYSSKGDMVSVEGRITTRSYDGKNGKVYVTEVTADQVSILGSKKESETIGGVPVEQLHSAAIAPTSDEEWVDESKAEESNNVDLNITVDDLPFY